MGLSPLIQCFQDLSSSLFVLLAVQTHNVCYYNRCLVTYFSLISPFNSQTGSLLITSDQSGFVDLLKEHSVVLGTNFNQQKKDLL